MIERATDAPSPAPVAPCVVITEDTTRADLAETLALLNVAAKAMSRRGKVGTMSDAYRVQHGRIDAVLEDLLARG